LKGVAPENVKLIDIYKGVVPFIPLQIIALIFLYIFPAIATWLPNVMH